MRKFQFYQHEDSTDLVIEPIRIIYINKVPKRIKVKAKLYTCGYPGKLHLMDIDEWEILETNTKWKLYK